MSKISRKQAICSNCSYAFAETTVDNFCPNCGQENLDKNVSFGDLFSDFIGNYLSLDSKLFRTIPRLMFFPGFLTNAFNNGKRISYLTPIRIYLFMSVLYFSFFAAQFSGTEEDASNNTPQERIDSIFHLTDSTSNRSLREEANNKDSIIIEKDTIHGTVLTVLLWTSDYLSGGYIALLLMAIFAYFLIALKKVYQQSWTKSILKGVIFGLFYPICLGIAVSFTGVAAFLMF